MRVSKALARSKQGVDRLPLAWEGLRTALDGNGWDEARCDLARDMLGIRVELGAGCMIRPRRIQRRWLPWSTAR